MKFATDRKMFKKVFSAVKEGNPLWDEIPAAVGAGYRWQQASTYVRLPPYFDGSACSPRRWRQSPAPRCLEFGDSITTDHISPAGGIRPSSPAGKVSAEHGVAVSDFNT